MTEQKSLFPEPEPPKKKRRKVPAPSQGPIREWRCAAHGEFESREHACPYGCPQRFVVQEFRTAPAIRHAKTSYTDRTLQGLADSCGLTDMSNRNGSVMNSRKPQTTRPGEPDFSPRWVDIPHAKPGWSRREGETSPVITTEQIGQPGLQPQNIVNMFQKANIIGSTAEDFHGRGPSIAASKEANMFVGHARAEDLK